MLIPAKPKVVQRCQEGPDSIAALRRFRLTLDNRWRALLTRARGTLGTDRRRRAFDLGTPRPRARRALSLRLVTLGAVQNDRLGFRNGRLEHIVAEIGHRRHFALQDVAIQIRTGLARRHCGLQDILGHVRFAARGTDGPRRGIRTAAGAGFLTASAPRSRFKPLLCRHPIE